MSSPGILLVVLGLAAGAMGCGSTVSGGDDDGSSADGADDGADDGGSDDGSDDGTGSGPGPTGGNSTCAGQMVCDPCPPICDGNGNVTGCDCSCSDEPPTCDLGEAPSCSVIGTWMCQPGDCPTSEPVVGEACDTDGLTCSYDVEVDCGDQTTSLYACEDGAWAARSNRCQPMPCREWTSSDDCQAGGCRWLEPGCDDDALPAAGCFEEFDCDEGSCPFGNDVCMTVSVDPCWDADCRACSEQVSVCVEQAGGQ